MKGVISVEGTELENNRYTKIMLLIKKKYNIMLFLSHVHFLQRVIPPGVNTVIIIYPTVFPETLLHVFHKNIEAQNALK